MKARYKDSRERHRLTISRTRVKSHEKYEHPTKNHVQLWQENQDVDPATVMEIKPMASSVRFEEVSNEEEEECTVTICAQRNEVPQMKVNSLEIRSGSEHKTSRTKKTRRTNKTLPRRQGP